MEPYKSGTAFLSEETWRKHANPWSVWTRLPILALISGVLWFREPLGWALWPSLGFLMLWTWLNPRAFPEPKNLDSWASQSTLGERIWLSRKHRAIPRHHQRAIRCLVVVTAAGVPLIALGLWQHQPTSLVAGLLLCYLGKLWFLDRMVWLCRESALQVPQRPAQKET
ncbi:MAG: DUF6653 family protein [Verrucomicrobiia bacterium]